MFFTGQYVYFYNIDKVLKNMFCNIFYRLIVKVSVFFFSALFTYTVSQTVKVNIENVMFFSIHCCTLHTNPQIKL